MDIKNIKIETITNKIEQQIIEHKKVNIHSQEISPEEASYNVGAVDALTKVLEILKEQP